MTKLGIPIPVYSRNVTFVVSTEVTDGKLPNRFSSQILEGVVLTLLSADGLHCPYILQLDVSIVGNSEKSFKLTEQPYKLVLSKNDLPEKWEENSLELSLTLNFARGCSYRTFDIKHKVEMMKVENSHTLEITRIDFNTRKEFDISLDLSMDDGFYELRSGKRSPMYKNLMPDKKPKKNGGGGRPKKKPKSEEQPMEEQGPSAEELKR